MFLATKMESNHQVSFDILNLKNHFKIMFNMDMFLDFVVIVFDNHMFKTCINRIH
jgi:hypothetical protein